MHGFFEKTNIDQSTSNVHSQVLIEGVKILENLSWCDALIKVHPMYIARNLLKLHLKMHEQGALDVDTKMFI